MEDGPTWGNSQAEAGRSTIDPVPELRTAVEAVARSHRDILNVEVWEDGSGSFGLNLLCTEGLREDQLVAEIRTLVAKEVGYDLRPEAVRVVQTRDFFVDEKKPEDVAALARARAGRTKRSKTRFALLSAAEKVFSANGWLETRMEDVASAAGVSVATAYNYFPSKYSLIGHVFGPKVAEVQVATRSIAETAEPVDVIERHLVDLAVLGHRYKSLAVAFISSVHEYTARVGGPPNPDDDEDPRLLATLPDLTIELIDAAQQRGDLRRWPTAREAGTTVTNVLLLRLLTRPDETEAETAELALTILFGMLAPEMLCDAAARRPFKRRVERLVQEATRTNYGAQRR